MQSAMLRDNGENPSQFEPLMVGETSPLRAGLNDLALQLATKAAALGASLHPFASNGLADLVRSMNCYYSNLIEGHNTHPIDIELALAGDYSTDPEKRDLQLEAKAHIAVQKWIDEGGLPGFPTDPQSIAEMHRRFCSELPARLLTVTNPQTGTASPIFPGQWRAEFVRVGHHKAISPGAVPRFMARLHQYYSSTQGLAAVLACACAHHRLLWVHPFLDGNGRVARLMSYAMLRNAVGAPGLWSVSRGLARRVDDYKKYLQACDASRQGDLDGRGALSEKALAHFIEFFLLVCIEQVDFMSQLMRPAELRDRILVWAHEQMRAGHLAPQSDIVLSALLYQGRLERSEVAGLLGISDRSARRVTSALLKAGVIHAESTRAPLRLVFPARYADRWMPGLFPPGSASVNYWLPPK